MEPLKKGELKVRIKWAKAIFDGTEVPMELETEPGSVCHFFKPFDIGGDRVRLRLDWSDIDVHGNPMLDADFFNRNTGKERKLSGSRKDSHHTQSRNSGERTYHWGFSGYSQQFSVLICWLISIEATASVGASIESKVIRKI